MTRYETKTKIDFYGYEVEVPAPFNWLSLEPYGDNFHMLIAWISKPTGNNDTGRVTTGVEPNMLIEIVGEVDTPWNELEPVEVNHRS